VWAYRRAVPAPARERRLGLRPALVPVGVLAVAAAAVVGLYGQRPAVARADRVVETDLSHFDGTMISAANETHVRADLSALRTETHGSVFILEAKAAFYYLAGDLQDPTPYDFPDRTDLGPGGQRGLLTTLQRRHTRWICLPRSAGRTQPVSVTAPVQLEQGLQHSYRFVERLHLCNLYTARTGPGSVVGVQARTGPRAARRA